jgi:hypothetical protein
MSCHPGTPCYGSTTVVDPCIAANSSSSNCCDTILYCSTPLPNTGIETNDNLCLALQKIDAEFSNIQVNVDAINGLQKVGDNIKLGGALVEPTIINIAGKSLSLTNVEEETNLQYLLVLTNAGVIKKYPATSLGQTVTLEDNVGLEWTNLAETNLSTKYNTLIPDGAISVKVGGAEPQLASWWKEKTLVQVLDYILFPLQLPTYTLPTISLTVSSPASPTTYLEIGSTIAINATGLGTKNDAGPFTQFVFTRTVNGTPSTFTVTPGTPQSATAIAPIFFPDPNNPNFAYPGVLSQPSYTIPPSPTGTVETSLKLKVQGTYNQGERKPTSYNQPDSRGYGNTVDTPQAAGTIMSNEIEYKATYPYYFGYVDGTTRPTAAQLASLINGTTPQSGNPPVITAANQVVKKVEDSSGNVTVNFNNGTTAQRWNWIAIPKSTSPDNTKLSWYVTDFNRGNISYSEGPFGKVPPSYTGQGSPFEADVTPPGTPAIWQNVPYRFYITAFQTNMNTVRFQNTIISGQPT